MRRIVWFTLAAVLCAAAFAATADTRLLHHPDIHGDQVVFTYAGDLWIVSSQGGTARKLTTYPGQERFPKFSPDGRSVAFTGDYDGNNDVFVIPAAGGEPRRLTYHPGDDGMLDWYPDGQAVLFRSGRASFWNRFNRLFKVSIDGGLPEMLPLPTGELSSLNADGTKLAYNRMGTEFRTWKRYRGGMAPDIWIYDLVANTAEVIAPSDANDLFPMWQGDTIYFVSDRGAVKVQNLYAYDLKTKKVRALTDYKEYDVQWPGIGPGAIVYENGGYLYIMDLKTEKSRKLSVEVRGENLAARPVIKNVSDCIHGFGLSPTGVRALFEARGDIFTVPAKKGEIRNLTRTPGIRERDPAWSPNGKWVAYFSDASGEYEIYLRPADGKGEATQLTKGSRIWYQNLAWSPDSQKLLLSDAAVNLYYIDIEKKELVKVDHGQYEGFSNFITGVWSPDSKWIAYDKASANGLDSIYLYSLADNKSHKITGDMTDDSAPAWDPEGRYLYFVANREFNYSFSAIEFMHYHYNPGKIVAVTLQADTPSPFIPESDEEKVVEEKPKDGDKPAEGGKPADGEKTADAKPAEAKDGAAKADKDKPKTVEIKIDFEGLENRIIDLPVPDGNYVGIVPDKEQVFFASVGVPGSGAQGATLQVYDLKKRELKTVIGGVNGVSFSFDVKKILVQQGGGYAIIDAKPDQKPTDRLNLAEMKMTVDPRAEWPEIYTDAWRITRDFFYDPNMHGVDWAMIKERYGAMLPDVAHRDDLNYLIGEMIAELNSSHTYRGGGDYPDVPRLGVGLLGCDFELDAASGRYRIARIYPGQNWDPTRRGPLAQPGLKVKEGDYLLAVNGQPLKHPTNPYALLANTAGKAIPLTVNAQPTDEGATEIVVTPVANELMLRYRYWVDANRRKVEEATGGRVGYLHMAATAEPGVEGFSRDFYPQVRKDALIIDLRYNSGGHIPDMYMSRLDRKPLGLWATRYTDPTVIPAATHYGPKVCLANGYSGSGGDAFPYFFRKSGLGELIGTRTWGGLIGLSGTPPLMDNGGVQIADFSFYNTDGEWDVEGKGVSPDIEVDDRPDLVVAGHDPCLEKAIEVLIEELKTYKQPKLPIRPPKNPVR
ncbi:MAG TPA: PDZ domain-containing protein [Acidobacteriota bacterium]|nr:PDZ domain-containing protein [Acidobacteriota bacterium]